MPPTTPFSGVPFPPSYESVAFAHPDNGAYNLISAFSFTNFIPEVDKKNHSYQPPTGPSTSSQQREMYTMPIAPENLDKEPPVYDYGYPRDHTQMQPNHSEAQCLQQGGHVTQTQYGSVGVGATLLRLPLILGAMWMGRRVTCQRCNKVIKEGSTPRDVDYGRRRRRRPGPVKSLAGYLIDGEVPQDYGRRRHRRGGCGRHRREGRYDY